MTDLDAFFDQIEREHAARKLPKRIWDRDRWTWAEWRPRQVRAKLQCARERLSRGWDYRDLWSLDHHIASTLGAQLVEMARIAHGWPPDYPGEFDGWVGDLKHHGRSLVRYAETDGGDWEPCADHEIPVGIPGAVAERIRSDATTALHWVAEWLGALWD